MGYVLPFGQMSFWGATVITNLLSPFPCLVEWVCGGLCSQSDIEEVLSLSFSTPISPLWFYSSSSFYLHFSNNPLRLNTNNKIPFFPFILLKDFVGLILV